MVQLSNLPGHNYVSACGGYIDGVFESYVKNYGNTVSNREIAFPDSTIPNPDINNSNNLQFQNPYKVQPTKWQQEIKERSDELKSLQNQNGANGYGLSSTEFPKTYADLSFSERIENERTGLMPYKDLKAYKPLNVKTAEEWCAKDGEHYNSNECWNWRCGLNGREAQTANCISYRCSKSDYYAAHEDECKRHELCSGNKKNSDECMRYRCYVDPDQDFEDCKRWKCTHDDTFKSENEDMCNGYECDINYVSTSSDACKQLLCGTCTETAFTPGQYSTHPNCKDYLCDYCTPYYNDNVTLCQPPQDSGGDDDPQDGTIYETSTLLVGDDCTPANPAHVKVAQITISGRCEIIECEEGWVTNNDRSKCEAQEPGIIMAMYEMGTPRKLVGCFDQCGIDHTDDGLTKTLREQGLLDADKSVCLIRGDPYVYYEDNINKKFAVPKSKKNDLVVAINRLSENYKYGCFYAISWGSSRYIVLKDEKTEQDIDNGRHYKLN